MAKPVVHTITDNATDNGLQQDSGVVAATPLGDFYAIWRDSGNFNSGHADIVGRHFDAFGNPLGSDVSLLPLNNAFGVPFNASQPATVALPISGQADGTATAFTDNFNNGPDFDVYVVRTNASLSRLEAPILIDGSTSVTNDPSVTSFADGSLVVSYTLQISTAKWDIMARTVSASGSVGAPITLFDDTDRSDLSDLATLKNGNFVAVFESPFLGSPTDLDSFFTIKTETGVNVVSPTTVVGAGSTATETNPHVAALAGGGFVVTWTDSAGDESGTSQGIRASVYNANGGIVAGDILVNQFNQAGTQLSNDVTALPDGGFEVFWEDIAAGVDRVQRFDSGGHLIGTPIIISNLATFNINAATLTNERTVYTFNDFSSGNNNTDSAIVLNPQTRDFNTDGFSDILWHNDNGQAAIWEMNGTNQIPGDSQILASNPGPSWNEIGAGDFNGDGHSDILWQNVNGQVAVWDMNGTTQIPGGSQILPSNPGPSWKAVGTGDFNADGSADILFQNTNGQAAIWEISGNAVIGGGAVSPNPGPGWKVIGTGDFNGDGYSDILWQDASTGQTAIWEMNGANIIGGGAVSLNAGPGWKAIGTGDFNGDGRSDILLQNTSSGQVAIWEMNGTSVIGGGIVSSDPGPNWHAMGTGDFNGDGFSDILWQNVNGQAAIWEMNGTTQIPGGTQILASNPGPSWHAVKT